MKYEAHIFPLASSAGIGVVLINICRSLTQPSAAEYLRSVLALPAILRMSGCLGSALRTPSRLSLQAIGASIELALVDGYLSRDPSPSKRASYIRRTMTKARDWRAVAIGTTRPLVFFLLWQVDSTVLVLSRLLLLAP